MAVWLEDAVSNDPIRRDHLDTERYFGLELPGKLFGIEGRLDLTLKTNLRLVNSVDRFFAAGPDWLSALAERSASRIRAESDAEIRMIQASKDYDEGRVPAPPGIEERAIRSELSSVLQKQENIEAVAIRAVEARLAQTSEAAEANGGPDDLDPAFLNDFKEGAGRAFSEELRERWAKVLVQEAREPGTFGRSALRIVGEIDPDLAYVFDKFARNRIGRIIPTSSITPVHREAEGDFANLGLVERTGWQETVPFFEVCDPDGIEIHAFGFDRAAFGVTLSDFKAADQEALREYGFNESRDKIQLSVTRLTRAGKAIASLSDGSELENTARLAAQLREVLGPEKVQTYRVNSNSSSFMPADLTPEVRKLDVWPS